MRNHWKILRIIGIFLILMVTVTAVGIYLIASVFNDETIGIIGGADVPTAIFLGTEFKWIVLLLAGELLSGIGCIIASVILKKKDSNKH